jgi:hypothetical protein
VCHGPLFPGFHFLAPIDMTDGLSGTTCTLTGHADLAQLIQKDVIAILRTLGWLSKL